MDFLRLPKFITDTEALELSSWVLENKDKPFFENSNMQGNRITTRYCAHEGFSYPEVALQVRKRIVDLFELHEQEAFNFFPRFKNGIIASCAFSGDTCYEHVDPVWVPGFNTIHCNVVTQSPDRGGDLVINGVTQPMTEKDLVCYVVSRAPHSTTLVEGDKPRLMWLFGFCMDDDKWSTVVEKYT